MPSLPLYEHRFERNFSCKRNPFLTGFAAGRDAFTIVRGFMIRINAVLPFSLLTHRILGLLLFAG